MNYVAGIEASGNQTSTIGVFLSPTLKTSTITAGQNIAGVSGFDAVQFIEAYIDSGRFTDPLAAYRARVPDYQAMLRQVLLDKEKFPTMPVSEDFDIAWLSYSGEAVPDSMRTQIKIETQDKNGYPVLSQELFADECWAKRITLSYGGATDADTQIINSYGGLYNTPCYLVNLTPVLRVNGRVVSRGLGEIPMAEDQKVRITFNNPDGSTQPPWEKIFPAGVYLAFGMDVGRARGEVGTMQQTFSDTLDQEPYVGKSLGRGVAHFLNRKCGYVNDLAASQQIMDLRGINAFCYSTAVSVAWAAGVPQKMSLNGMASHIGYLSFKPVFLGSGGKESGDRRLQDYTFAAGMTLFYNMAAAPQQSHNQESVSALKALTMADSIGMPVLKISNTGTTVHSLTLSYPVAGGGKSTGVTPGIVPGTTDRGPLMDIAPVGCIISGGDGNDIASVGETFDLQIVLDNHEAEALNLTTVALYSNDAYAHVENIEGSMADIPGGMVRTSAYKWHVQFKPNMPAGYLSSFTLELTSRWTIDSVTYSRYRAFGFWFKEGQRFGGMYWNVAGVIPKIEEYLSQGYNELLVPLNLITCQDWQGTGIAALAVGTSKSTNKAVSPASASWYLGNASAGPVSYDPTMTVDAKFLQYAVGDNAVIPTVDPPKTKGVYILGETVPVSISYRAEDKNGNLLKEWPGSQWDINTAMASDNGQPWKPGQYGVRTAVKTAARVQPIDTMTGPWLLAEVRIVVDKDLYDPNNPTGSNYEINHTNDNPYYLPEGTYDATYGGPKEIRALAVLWGSDLPLTMGNWMYYNVDLLNEWTGRPEIMDVNKFPLNFSLYEVSKYKGWCSNMGDGTGEDFKIKALPGFLWAKNRI